MLDHWNMSTMVWLRYVVYERWRTVAGVFFFSAFWHGFYAGYYLTFLGAALFLETSRLVSLLDLWKCVSIFGSTLPLETVSFNLFTCIVYWINGSTIAGVNLKEVNHKLKYKYFNYQYLKCKVWGEGTSKSCHVFKHLISLCGPPTTYERVPTQSVTISCIHKILEIQSYR